MNLAVFLSNTLLLRNEGRFKSKVSQNLQDISILLFGVSSALFSVRRLELKGLKIYKKLIAKTQIKSD